MAELILHHYPTSPFSEKVRVAMGIKGLAWRSVIIPVIMPKPDLVALTGGYRKTPVLQVGADVYCDTQCILRELERRFPEPSLYRGTDAGTANALAFWSDRSLFSPAVGLALGARPEVLTPEFVADRAAFSGRELDPARLLAARPMLLDQLRPQLLWFETMLGDGRPFLLGEHPTLVDCAAYHVMWFMRGAGGSAPPLDELEGVRAWMKRVRAIGHGRPSEMTSQEALGVARDATPAAQAAADPGDPFGRKPGDRVVVIPDDTGKDPVAGELVAISRDEVVIRRVDAELGELAVHFPRAGMVIKPAR
jgi:glutathione S-transferase